VIVRISSAFVPLSKFTAYLEYVQGSEIPGYEAAPGLGFVTEEIPCGLCRIDDHIVLAIRGGNEAIRGKATIIIADRAENEYSVIRSEAHTYELALYRDGKVQGEDVQGTSEPE
jgi:hypothetical protein